MPYQDQFLQAVAPNPQYLAGRYVYNPLMYWEPQDNNVSFAATQIGAASWVFTPIELPQEAYLTAMNIYLSNSYSATNAGSSRADTVSIYAGIYILSNSSLTLASYLPAGQTATSATSLCSASQTTAFTVTGSSSSVSYQGLKQYPIIFPAAGLNPGNYWVGIASQVASAGNAIAGALSNVVFSFAGGQSVFKGAFGSSSNASNQLRLGAGFYSASSTAVPSVVGFSEIVGSAQGNTNNPVFNFAAYSA